MLKSFRFAILITLYIITILAFPLPAQTSEGAADFTAGLRARRENDAEAAIVLLRQAALRKDFILSDYAQFEIGEAYYSTGKYSSAIPEYYKVATRHRDSILLPQANLKIGKSYFNLKNYACAIESFNNLIGSNPESAEARYLIAQALEKQKKWKEAYFAYEETDLFHPLSFFGKKSRLAINALKKKHKKLPRFKASASALFKKGMTCFERDDFEMAANVFNRLAREYPGSKYVGEAWLMLGRAELQTGSSSAIPNLERAAQGPPNLAGRAHYYLGLAHARRGNYDRAIALLKKINPDSGLADDAAYWIAYYEEALDETDLALADYHNLIKKYPYSKSVPAAIWRMGRIYYWNSDFSNAAAYLHLAQLYPPGEDSPRCYFFEAKALERTGNRGAALELYKKLADRFDHTYYAYRAQEKLAAAGSPFYVSDPFSDDDFNEALNEIDSEDQEKLSAIMGIWEQTNSETLQSENSKEARVHFLKYKELMDLGLTDYAADEARYLVNITSDVEKESAQTKLGEMLVNSGEYRRPIRFADRKVKEAVLSGKPRSVSKKVWQLAYPRGYWKHVSQKAGRFRLDPYLALAVIREESRFNPKATSRSRARGLMQIMPRTGRGIARDIDIRRYRTGRLYEPALNIEMGVYYLSNLIKNFKNNTYLALAGYNGGPNKIKNYVNSWYNGDLSLVDIDEFIESIPSRETRLYVQKVMGSYFEYKRLYGRKRG